MKELEEDIVQRKCCHLEKLLLVTVIKNMVKKQSIWTVLDIVFLMKV